MPRFFLFSLHLHLEEVEESVYSYSYSIAFLHQSMPVNSISSSDLSPRVSTCTCPPPPEERASALLNITCPLLDPCRHPWKATHPLCTQYNNFRASCQSQHLRASPDGPCAVTLLAWTCCLPPSKYGYHPQGSHRSPGHISHNIHRPIRTSPCITENSHRLAAESAMSAYTKHSQGT